MTAPGRLMSPQLSFQTAMRSAQTADSAAGTTVTAAEAKAAISQLEGHPHADAAERARIVNEFLGTAAGLGADAQKVLRDFVASQQGAPGGLRADQLKAEASQSAKSAAADLVAARERLDALMQQGGKVDITGAVAALDKAAGAVAAAQQSLSGALRVADHHAQLASRQLGDAARDIENAQADIARLGSTKGGPTAASIERVLSWLEAPIPELTDAQNTLQPMRSDGPDVQTRKFPSDNEDNAGGGDVGGQATMKYPSDNEDSGGDAGGGGGVVSTMKAPSDNEDNAGGPPPADGGGGMMHTMKFPSDNEDNAGGGGGGVVATMKAPSDNEDNAGGPAPTDGVAGGPTTGTGAIKAARLQAMWSTFQAADQAGQVQWQNSLPLGPRYAEGFLHSESHVDAFGYDALVAVGNLAPGAPQHDPNTVDTFWVRQTGGIAGLTRYAGPFRLQ